MTDIKTTINKATFNIHIKPQNDIDNPFTGYCPEVKIWVYGKTEKEVIKRMKAVIEFYAETVVDEDWKRKDNVIN